MRLILASASPRRAELLQAAGIAFDIVTAQIDEQFHPGEPPQMAVARVAELKADAVAHSYPGRVVLAADTTVVVDDTALAKPVDAADAARMLRLLSGRTHDVMTGMCLQNDSQRLVRVEATRVHMARLTDEEIAWYISTGEPYDKAGAYAVQGRAGRFITRIEGSYSNVVGLPISRVYDLLKQLGCDILEPQP